MWCVLLKQLPYEQEYMSVVHTPPYYITIYILHVTVIVTVSTYVHMYVVYEVNTILRSTSVSSVVSIIYVLVIDTKCYLVHLFQAIHIHSKSNERNNKFLLMSEICCTACLLEFLLDNNNAMLSSILKFK